MKYKEIESQDALIAVLENNNNPKYFQWLLCSANNIL